MRETRASEGPQRQIRFQGIFLVLLYKGQIRDFLIWFLYMIRYFQHLNVQ